MCSDCEPEDAQEAIDLRYLHYSQVGERYGDGLAGELAKLQSLGYSVQAVEDLPVLAFSAPDWGMGEEGLEINLSPPRYRTRQFRLTKTAAVSQAQIS